jgi:hypothetical protein
VGELLIPVVGTMRQELLSGSYIQADETPVQVQIEEGGGKHHQACGELDATGCHRAKTGSTSAAYKPDRRSQQFYRSWKAVGD